MRLTSILLALGVLVAEAAATHPSIQYPGEAEQGDTKRTCYTEIYAYDYGSKVATEPKQGKALSPLDVEFAEQVAKRRFWKRFDRSEPTLYGLVHSWLVEWLIAGGPDSVPSKSAASDALMYGGSDPLPAGRNELIAYLNFLNDLRAHLTAMSAALQLQEERVLIQWVGEKDQLVKRDLLIGVFKSVGEIVTDMVKAVVTSHALGKDKLENIDEDLSAVGEKPSFPAERYAEGLNAFAKVGSPLIILAMAGTKLRLWRLIRRCMKSAEKAGRKSMRLPFFFANDTGQHCAKACSYFWADDSYWSWKLAAKTIPLDFLDKEVRLALTNSELAKELHCGRYHGITFDDREMKKGLQLVFENMHVLFDSYRPEAPRTAGYVIGHESIQAQAQDIMELFPTESC